MMPVVSNSISLNVRNLWVRRSKKFILVDVSFVVKPGEFLGIIGPNGAGKTTLLRAIAGERPFSGSILLNEENLYDSPEYWLSHIGYVPVDNVLHEQLTISQALYYLGRLRLGGESTKNIYDRVDTVLSEFGFPTGDQRRHTLLSKLSSGERKRVNICAELLTAPSLLLLDEPTSNLDPNAELELMHTLRDRAHRYGQTILVVTHTLNTISECDRVVFLENSRVREVGKPDELLLKLEQEVIKVPASGSNFYRWATVFDHFRTNEDKRLAQSPNPLPRESMLSDTGRGGEHIPFWTQLGLLLRRYLQIRINEPLVLVLTLALGFIGGSLLFVLPSQAFLRPEDAGDTTKIVAARQAVFFLAVVIALIGLIASFREISKEFRIYRHERLKGLSPLAYVLSKWIWLMLGVGILAPVALLVMLSTLGQPFPDIPLAASTVGVISVVTLILSCTAAVSLGLAISAGAGSDNPATIILALVVVFHVLLSGLVRNPALENLISPLSLLATTRWAFEGFSSSLGFYCWSSVKAFSEFNSFGHIGAVWLSLLGYVISALAVATIALYVRDSWATPRSLMRSVKVNLLPVTVLICCLLLLSSWASFLFAQSVEYNEMTFFDRYYGGIRFARVETVKDANFIQVLDGEVSQSQCGGPED